MILQQTQPEREAAANELIRTKLACLTLAKEMVTKELLGGNQSADAIVQNAEVFWKFITGSSSHDH